MNIPYQKPTSFDQIASNLLLLLLLLVRLVDQYIPIWIFGSNYPDWYRGLYAGLVYLLSIVLVWLNRPNLEKLNVDKLFVYLSILGGIFWVVYLPSNYALLALLALILIFRILKSKPAIVEEKRYLYSTEIWIFALISIGTAIAPALFYNPPVKNPVNLNMIIATLLEADLALVVFEELLFRGVLWAYLKQLNINEKNIIFIQAALFWIAHNKFLLLDNPYPFWISLPLNSLLFGMMVWRSKSLAPSTVVHLLYNCISILTLKVAL
jgi:membrane protease YdiL (CAAX protease family)